MFLERVSLISSILAVAFAAPKISESIPTWHLPCGELNLRAVPLKNLEEEMKTSLKNLRLQHQLTMYDYLNRDYEYLYERVRIGVDDHQYIPNWVPGKKDVNLIRKLADASTPVIVNYFPKLHMDLQKFAVAFEELTEDEPNSQIQQALKATQSYLTMMLCEVESNIISLPTIQLPTRVERSIMSHTERNPVDETRRLIRDWGVVLKYRDYLHAWRHVFNY
ncbi:hypothetical protein ALC60_12606 [Trachymyrmex zeteki]|uniref:Uncharacterized protein n=1 Tax=Mycetomoellerius zeteki TaxID=64791 RepID=A0A151WK95_9HYME|nr:PREDICTED: uncharacterized protein LOC108729047 [Trachymyrmex zeteki]KYQ48278.1 hypothetical protein ALC60_12606 [Trachymyrmex zeteki]